MSGLFPSQTTSTTTSGSETPESTRSLFELSGGARRSVPTDPFAGTFFAGATPLQREALGLQEGAIRGFLPQEEGAPGFGFSTRELGEDLISGRRLDPATNPFLAPLIEANLRPVEDRRIQASKELAAGAERFGATGGARAALLDTQLEADAATVSGDIRAGILGENFARERELQLLGPQFLREGFNLDLLPSQALGQVGLQEQGFNQIDVNEGLARRQEEVSAPFNFIRQLAAALSGQPQGTSGTARTTTPQNQTLQLLQFLLGAGALGVGGASLAGGNPAGGAALFPLLFSGNQPTGASGAAAI